MGKTNEMRSIEALELIAQSYARSAEAHERIADYTEANLFLTEQMVEVQMGMARASTRLSDELDSMKSED